MEVVRPEGGQVIIRRAAPVAEFARSCWLIYLAVMGTEDAHATL